ncbi:unnamed protein product, partial [Scytosiphon promiscuus]
MAMDDWKNMHLRMGWVVLGQFPAVAKMTRAEWQALFPDVLISAEVASSLNTWSHITVTDWRMSSDDPSASVPLDESMEILVDTLIRALGQGDLPAEACARLQLLDDALQEGLRVVRVHCRENRAALRNPALVARFAGFINDDFQLFITQWTRAAIDIKMAHVLPPDVAQQFPAVPVPTFPKTRGYINTGGLQNFAFYAESAASVITSPTKKMRVGAPGRYRSADVQYCFAFNNGECKNP